MSDSGLHPHHRAALVAGGIASLAISALVLAAYVPVAAIVLGAAAGCLALWAGYHWMRRKLGVRSSGRRWRAPRPRPARTGSGAKRPALGRRAGGRRGQQGPRRSLLRGAASGRPRSSGAPAAARAGRAGHILRRPGVSVAAPNTARGPRRFGGRLTRPVRGIRRILPTPLKARPGRKRPPTGSRNRPAGRRRRLAANAALLPAAVVFSGGRWLWHKTRRTKPVAKQIPVTNPPVIRRPTAQTKPATSPVAAPKRTGQPARTAKLPHHTTKGSPNIMNRIDAASEAVQQHVGQFEPENANDLDMFLARLPEFFASVGSAFRSVAARLADSYPVDASIPDRLNDIASTITGMGDYSGEAHAAHRARHEKELERIENPRPNEKFWDVSAQ